MEENPKAPEAAQNKNGFVYRMDLGAVYLYRTGSTNEDRNTSIELYRKGRLFFSRLNVYVSSKLTLNEVTIVTHCPYLILFTHSFLIQSSSINLQLSQSHLPKLSRQIVREDRPFKKV